MKPNPVAFGSQTVTIQTTQNCQSSLNWIMTDNINSITVTANADGTFNSELRYSAFGEIRYSSGVTPTNYQYTGQLSQQAIGLDYYVARWYDPVTAHFAQADTEVPDPGEPQTFDRYMYSNNNPITYNDPSGHDVGCAGLDESACSGWNEPTNLPNPSPSAPSWTPPSYLPPSYESPYYLSPSYTPPSYTQAIPTWSESDQIENKIIDMVGNTLANTGVQSPNLNFGSIPFDIGVYHANMELSAYGTFSPALDPFMSVSPDKQFKAGPMTFSDKDIQMEPFTISTSKNTDLALYAGVALSWKDAAIQLGVDYTGHFTSDKYNLDVTAEWQAESGIRPGPAGTGGLFLKTLSDAAQNWIQQAGQEAENIPWEELPVP